jgi:hypothetical protein
MVPIENNLVLQQTLSPALHQIFQNGSHDKLTILDA